MLHMGLETDGAHFYREPDRRSRRGPYEDSSICNVHHTQTTNARVTAGVLKETPAFDC